MSIHTQCHTYECAHMHVFIQEEKRYTCMLCSCQDKLSLFQSHTQFVQARYTQGKYSHLSSIMMFCPQNSMKCF